MIITKQRVLKFILIIVGFILLFSLLRFLINGAIVSVNVVDGSGNEASGYTLSAIRINDELAKPIGLFGVFFVPRDSVAFEARDESGNNFGGTFTKGLSIFNTQPLDVKVYPQNEVKKLSGESIGCTVFADDLNYEYNCGYPSYIVSYDTTLTPWTNKVRQVLDPTPYALPFMNGLISPVAVEIEEDSYFYALSDPANNTSNLINPPIKDETHRSLGIAIDHTDKSNQNLVFIDKQNKRLFFTDNLGQNYLEKSIDIDYNPQFDKVSCTLLKSTLYCMTGSSSDTADSEAEIQYLKDPKDPTLFVVQFGEQDTPVMTYKLDNGDYKDIMVNKQGDVFLADSFALYLAAPKGKKVDIKQMVGDYESYDYGEDIVYSKQNKLFKLDGSTGYRQLFYTSNLAITNVHSYGKEIVFTANGLDNTVNALHRYVILDTPAPIDRLEDKLPPVSMKDAPFRLIDYSGNSIMIVVDIETSSNRQTGEYLPVNMAEYEQAKLDSIQYLKNLGINTDNYKILFSY